MPNGKILGAPGNGVDDTDHTLLYKAFLISKDKDAPQGPHFAESGMTYDSRHAKTPEEAAKLQEDGWFPTLAEAQDAVKPKKKAAPVTASAPPPPTSSTPPKK